MENCVRSAQSKERVKMKQESNINQTETMVEFYKIKEMWMEQAVTEAAKDSIRNMSVYLSELDLRKNLRDTTQSRKMLEKLGTPPLQNVEEAKEILTIVRKGDCLTPYQLERVEKVLVAVRRLKDYLSRGKMDENPLSYYEENLDSLEELREEICRQIRGGEVDDYASKELQSIRTRMVRCEEQMKERAEQVLHANKQYMADSYCTFRNGRICVPLKKEYRLKISGVVLDKSSTGSTIFMEPASAAKYYEELQLCRISEENEVYQILYTLTAMVSDAADVMDENIKTIEKLDFILSKGKLSIAMDAVEPSINTGRKIRLQDARNPIMDRHINVPLQFEMGEKIRGIVITGPNTGGKTVALKTVMLNCMMAQCGLHVACGQADICMNGAYLCDIGDGQNITENLSTFSAHIKNVLDILGSINGDSFVIMDELGSGTDPAEGMGIATAILEQLRKSGCLFLVTTHYPEIKEYARTTEYIINARMTFDKETLTPTYQMVIGEAGESCAFYIADRLGMSHEMLQTAIRAAYGESALKQFGFRDKDPERIKKSGSKVMRAGKGRSGSGLADQFHIGDSVMIYPDKKIGIVCEPVNEKGVLRVQLSDKKIWINHKRVKLHVAAEELYPADYDFSILFDTAENRKIRHDMERKLTDEVIYREEI